MTIELTPITRVAGDPAINTQGSFIAGTTGLFFLTFSDINGSLFDPSDIDGTILDSDGATVETIAAADRLEFGQFVMEWQIPSTQDPGLYTLRVDYTLDQVGGSSTEFLNESFSVLEPDAAVISPVVIIFRKLLETLLGYSQRIPVFHEIGRLNEDRTKSKFSFPRWNQPAGAEIFVNGNLTTSGFNVDYLRGEISFTSILSTYDEIQASYAFRWFSDEELDKFIEQAVDVFNQYAPHSAYNIATLELGYPRAGITVAHQAAVFALRRIILDLHWQEPAKIFGGMERADRLTGSLNSLKENMEQEIAELYKQKAKGPYVGLTKTVTVPEFTLPGGRCLAYDSTVTYLVGNKAVTTTIDKLYELSKIKSIRVLSDSDGDPVFAEVSKIWKSGIKSVLKIEDDHGNEIEVSEDHIMFVDDKEVPASEISAGDKLTAIIDNKIVHSKVVNVFLSREVLTFDIEVPSTENLFVNNIKCHNSRWFRYLFKGG
jgi:hypothetical protein